jgi:hypothetical protein
LMDPAFTHNSKSFPSRCYRLRLFIYWINLFYTNLIGKSFQASYKYFYKDVWRT